MKLETKRIVVAHSLQWSRFGKAEIRKLKDQCPFRNCALDPPYKIRVTRKLLLCEGVLAHRRRSCLIQQSKKKQGRKGDASGLRPTRSELFQKHDEAEDCEKCD